MSSLLTSQGVVFATAMAVSAGTMILFATFRLQKTQEFSFNSISNIPPRSCISADGKKKEKKKKKVKFAEDVVEPSGNSEEYRKLRHFNSNNNTNNNFRHENKDEVFSSFSNSNSNKLNKREKVEEMPANRAALYNAMLKGRVINRVTYSY
ncbi:uncharacterized protein LOC125859560 [Solanum stenotomum]|uniref:uncharacterized protein LOC125859560 n=1 Tax=Solanum stenotomum TaxID=172797 RepID=UPI0020D065BA|nr:uncharacterized protein LOC125859560 [Solanum stenotomum]